MYATVSKISKKKWFAEVFCNSFPLQSSCLNRHYRSDVALCSEICNRRVIKHGPTQKHQIIESCKNTTLHGTSNYYPLFETLGKTTIPNKLRNCEIKNSTEVEKHERIVSHYNINKYCNGLILRSQSLCLARTSKQFYCTSTVNSVSKTDIPSDNIRRAPKSVLHNAFDVLSNELKQRELKLSPQYKIVKQGKTNLWMCIYNLKWPEEIKFSHTALSKMEASTKAALSALMWLKENKKINKEGQPIIYEKKDVKAVSKKFYPVLQISRGAEDGLKRIDRIFQSDLASKVLEYDRATKSEDDSPDLNQEWPKLTGERLKQEFRNLDYYLAKEPVQLPISQFKDEIIQRVENNRVLIIKGEPGCGKSTRVPQYVLEGWAKSAHSNDKPCRIVVTQPRRIAALSLAERVASEREESVGETVGYQIRFKSNFNNKTGRIMYCTTGILLRRLQDDPKLSDCTHVLIDEAHERDVNTDLLMNLLRHALQLNPNLNILVMSATIDTDLFQDYFDKSPTLHIPGFTYPVEQHFLSHSDQSFKKTLEMSTGKYPNVVTEDVVKMIEFIHKKKPEGAILCFLPGWDDIAKVRKLIPQYPDISVLCLHSRLDMSEQRRIFSRPPPGVRKVILTTNIAETSVTVDDVVYVLDTGIHKEQRFDIEKGTTCMDNHWISQASAIQRRGRAGRCQAGECFHMYPKSKYEEFLKFSIPEILRTSLTKILLDSKVYSNNMSAIDFHKQLICPPANSAIEKALEELKELELLDENENLTPLGRVLSDFQLPPKLSKAMVNSVIFKCVAPVIDIATLYSFDSALFSNSLMDKEQVRSVMSKFSKSSDHLALMEMFETWSAYIKNNAFDEADNFCYSTGLVFAKLRTISKLCEVHMDYLRKGLCDVLPISNDLSDNSELVKGVVLSGVGSVLQHRTWDIVKGRLKRLMSLNNHKATITSDSINCRRAKFPSDFLLHINETVSNLRHTTLVRETSLISQLTVLLFKNGDLKIEDIAKDDQSDKITSKDQVLLCLQGTNIKLLCDRPTASAIKNCKEALRYVTQYYTYQLTRGDIYNPEINRHWQNILKELNRLLELESIKEK